MKVFSIRLEGFGNAFSEQRYEFYLEKKKNNTDCL